MRKHERKKKRRFAHLTLTERLQMEAWLKTKTSVKQIAEMLHKDQSTIYREIRRGGYDRLNGEDYSVYRAYSPDIAEGRYRENLKAKGAPLKLGADREYAEYIEEKILKDKYSPKAVLGEIKKKGLKFRTTISYTTLYRYIDEGVFLRLTNKDLPVKRDKSKQRYKKIRPIRPPKGESIEKRPKEINERSTFGNWEMDCVIGTRSGCGALLVLTERLTRREYVRLLPAKTAANVVCALDGIEKKLGSEMFAKIFQTITVDNGSEFADYLGMERSIGSGKRTKIYYCHPYSSYERGSNENLNKMIRRWYPKGVSFANSTDADIARVENWMNNYPRGIFGYDTSAERYKKEINRLSG